MSTNISKEKREELIGKVKAIRNYISKTEQDQNAHHLLDYLAELEKEIKGKKYGLVFEEHWEGIDEVMKTHTPVLTEQKELFLDNGGVLNFLIEGDNLSSLELLLKTHKGKIDLIYIDPPYNTGNEDFIYDDKYIDADDAFRHSKYMSFIGKRLTKAKSLLSNEGVIFIQINDIEIAPLRMLCDDIFGEDNFLNIINVNMKNIAGASGGGEDKRLKKNCEYILIYARNYSLMPIFKGAFEYTEISELIQKYIDQGISWKYTSVLVYGGDKEYLGSTHDGDGNGIKIFARKNPIIKSINQISKEEGLSSHEVYKKYGHKTFQTTNAQSSIRTRIFNYRIEKNVKEDLISIEYTPKTGKNRGKIYEQFYKGDKCRLFVWLKDTSEIIDGKLFKKDLQGTYWDLTGAMKNLTKEGNVEFSKGKKPVDLLKRIIGLYPEKDITILDFFAGSGTTGHAVIEQNIIDNGSRKFILCTNNQNNICIDKTYRRLSNVISGYTTPKGKIFKPSKASLKYFEIQYVPIQQKMYYEYADELLKHVRELVELENGINFTGNAKVAIILTDEELDAFMINIDTFQKCRKLYLGHNVLLNGEQEQLLKDNKIKVNTIPDYYYKELHG